MSKIEDHVVSLDLAKKLKDTGYPQEGHFWWRDRGELEGSFISPHPYFVDYFPVFGSKAPRAAVVVAPLASELGEWLPNWVVTVRGGGSKKNTEKYICAYKSYEKGKSKIKEFNSKKEADARAEMLIWLVENSYLTFESGDDGTNS